MTLWIRVDADVADNPKIGRFAARLGVEIELAVGHLVRLWGKMAEQKSDGKLTGVRGVTIESWANWRGKKGHFAKHFRQTFVGKGSIVKGWGERQGKLILKQLAHRAYMRDWRGGRAQPSGARETHGERHVNVTEGSPEVSRETHGERHVRPLTVTNTKPIRIKEPAEAHFTGQPVEIAAVIEQFVAKTGRRVQT